MWAGYNDWDNENDDLRERIAQDHQKWLEREEEEKARLAAEEKIREEKRQAMKEAIETAKAELRVELAEHEANMKMFGTFTRPELTQLTIEDFIGSDSEEEREQ